MQTNFIKRVVALTVVGWVVTSIEAAELPSLTNYVRGQFHELNDNGAWSWFMDERVIVDKGRLIVGSVRAHGKFADKTLPGWGNVELAVMDMKSGATSKVVLHENLEQDDHNNPGLLVLCDGRYLAAYSKHGQETTVYYRISTNPGDPLMWEDEKQFRTPGTMGSFAKDSFTYCNPMRLSSENNRTYLFHRSHGLDPNYLLSDDDGRTWRYGGKLYVGRDGYSPYTKYISNNRDTIHFVATEDHPRNFNNSLYHAFIRDGKLYRSDGVPVVSSGEKTPSPGLSATQSFSESGKNEVAGASLSTSTNCGVRPWDLTRIFQGGSNHVAWMTDIHLDKKERPVVLFTVQVNGAGIPRGQGGDDHRFHYARWDGKKWIEHEIAYAGKRLYSGEDDYTGLGAIDPQDTSVIYLSSDADLKTGEPLISAADGKRHHEIFRGETKNDGATWTWTPVTGNSTMDNLRPLVPISSDKRTALVWMRGTYRANRGEWTTKVVTTLLER